VDPIKIETDFLRGSTHFQDNLAGKHPEATLERCIEAIRHQIEHEVQTGGEICIWGKIVIDGREGVLRVVLAEDKTTIITAHRDRNARKRYLREILRGTQ
jgi:hypothetical protein